MSETREQNFKSVDGQTFPTLEEQLQRDLVVAACDIVAKTNKDYDQQTLLGLYDYRTQVTEMMPKEEVNKVLANENLILTPVDAILQGAHLQDIDSQ